MSLRGFNQHAISPTPGYKREEMPETPNNKGVNTIPMEDIENTIKLGSHMCLFRAARQGLVEGVRETSKHKSKQAMNEQDEFGMTALHHAVRGNKKEVVTALLDMGADIDARTSESYTPLMLAVIQNHEEIVSILMKNGADITIQLTDGYTALHFAARRSHVEICRLLLNDPRVNVNLPDTSGVTPLHFACVEGDVKICELLINRKANILVTDSDDKTLFHYAAFYGREIIAELLFALAAQEGFLIEDFIDNKDLEHLTPMHSACCQGHTSLVELFLIKGANINARKDDDRKTALHIATENGHLNVVELLIARGAKIEATDIDDRTPLHCAAGMNRLAVIKYLIQQGAEIDAQDKWGATPFLVAVRFKRKEAAMLLLEFGANIAATEVYQHNCIHIAVRAQSYDVLAMLLEKDDGKLIEGSNYEMKKPIHFAAVSENTKILSALLEKRCHTGVKDKSEKTPLHFAAENGMVENVEILAQLEPASLNEKDNTGTTPLHYAASRGFRKTIDSLMRLGANPLSRNGRRWTALHCAVEYGEIKTIQSLLNKNKDLLLNAVDQDKNTPLHLAARYGKVKVLELLLDQGANATALNSKDQTCMDIAIDWGESEVAAAIVQHGRWMEVMGLKRVNVERPMKALIEKLPGVAELVLDRCITRSSQAPTHPDYTVNIDTSLLDPSSDDTFYAPAVMSKYKRENLLKHAVCQASIKLNWSKLGKPGYILNFSIFMIFVILFTVFIITERMKVKIYGRSQPNASKELEKLLSDRSSTSNAIPVIILLFTIISFLKEMWQIYVLGLRYFKDLANLVEWGLFVFLPLFVAPFLAEENVYPNSDVLWSSGVIALFLSYVNIILYARRIGDAGLYVSMYLEVLKTFCKVILVFAVFLLSWVLVFLVLLKEEDSFKNFGLSLMKVLVMFVGELDYSDILVNGLAQSNAGVPYVPLPELTFILFAVFFITVPILLMNLLVGLAVGDIDAIQSSASMKVMTMKVDYVMNIRERFPKFLLRHFHTTLLVVKPNRNTWSNRWLYSDMAFRMDKRFLALLVDDNSSDDPEDEKLKEIKTELAKQKERTKALQASLDSQTKLLQLIAKKLDPSLDTSTEQDTAV